MESAENEHPKNIHSCMEFCAMENFGRKKISFFLSVALIPRALFTKCFSLLLDFRVLWAAIFAVKEGGG
jgi:hypothetical protein